MFVVGGFAFVSEKDQLSLVMREFESRLMKGLQVRPLHPPRSLSLFLSLIFSLI